MVCLRNISVDTLQKGDTEDNNNNNTNTATTTNNNNNKPDIIIKNKKEKTCTLIDVAIPADRNVVQKNA